jgi:hypothetical protein
MSFVLLHVSRFVLVHVILPFLFVLALPATLYPSDRMLALERHGRSVVP